MRLPAPIDVRPTGPSWRLILVGFVVVGSIGAAGYVVTRDGGDAGGATGPAGSLPNNGGSESTSGQTSAATAGGSNVPAGAGSAASRPAPVTAGTGGGPVYAPLAAPVRLIDAAAVAAASPTTVTVRGATSAAETNLVALRVDAVAPAQAADISIVPCGTTATTPSVAVAAGATVTRTVIVPISGDGDVCATSTADATLSIEIVGFLDQGAARPFSKPVTLIDTRAGGATDDGRYATIGVRPQQSTIRVPVVERFAGLADVGALMVSVVAVDPLAPGELRVFAPEAAASSVHAMTYQAATTARAVDVVSIGPSGQLCVSTTGSTDLIVEIIALVPSSVSAQLPAGADGAPTCPGEELFPGRRIVAMYGTQRSARLGVLGEQTPAASVTRLEEIAAPWRAGDRPVLPAFELIATLATGTPEDRGTYNIRSSPEFVQEYLDVARRHGYYLILDLQPGQSDFLTEATYYEEFLRQPDVGLALDPEWRTQPPNRPKGGFVGQVDASEVNAVIEYVARLVGEEDLPEKLVVIHQFQDRMITNKDQLVELPGVALTIHMDGFGPRPEKLNSYEVVKVGLPLNMGLKLFYDEDTDLLGADDVLNGLFDPVPDMITYQ